ncbi:MAG: TonB-dependent receptor [Gammaproteobacteria bacterium]|nr:TonB-dependent receptor [Gammaproteobacteria bacterium]
MLQALRRFLPFAMMALIVSFAPNTTLAQSEESADADEDIEILVVIGSRNKAPRTVEDSTAPIDFIQTDDISAIGNAADITDILRSVVPYFNASMASGDGDTFVRPTSLRGLAPDQSLVMINGKRRHRAALIAEFVPAAGKGAHGPNIGMIPSIAMENVQILRDGASAQYGSDAISGVVNFQMKDSDEGGMLRAQLGRFYEGEQSFKIDGNIGMRLGSDGFANFSFERTYNEALSRGKQRPDAQALIDQGVLSVGQDSPFADKPFAQTWGRPRSDGLRLFMNAGHPVSESTDIYVQSNYASVQGRYRFFYRAPGHVTLRSLAELGFTGLPGGFTPYFDGETTDYSVVSGWRGTMPNGMYFDVSVGVGNNEIDFTLFNTINQSIGLNSNGEPLQRDFDVGELEQTELSANVDLSRQISDAWHIAGGMEWRREIFAVKPGVPTSYEGAGSSGFKGFEPRNSGSFSRQNVSSYVEVEREAGSLITQYAARYEGYSDFGGTLNGKFAMRYHFDDRITGRGAISTGFHAPTPGQANIQKVTTTFDANVGGQVEQGLVPPDHPLAIAAGGAPLKEETSLNVSVGFSVDADEIFEDARLTFDVYDIEIKDRIYKTQTVPSIDPNTGIGTNVSFYTNALDIQSKGFDIVLTLPLILRDITSDLSLALNRNEVSVKDQNLVNGIAPVSFADVEDIENSYPKLRIVASSTTFLSDNATLMIRANYFGEHYDERGRIGGNPGTKLLDPTLFFDMEIRYDVTEDFRMTLGFVNVFDSYVDEIKDTVTIKYANRQNVGLPYARRTAANFEGGSAYITLDYTL